MSAFTVIRRIYLIFFNAVTALSFLLACRAVVVSFVEYPVSLSNANSPLSFLHIIASPSAARYEVFDPPIFLALVIAAFEAAHAAMGFTGRVSSAGMFVAARSLIAFVVARMAPNPGSAVHAALCFVWGLGEVVRFGSHAMNETIHLLRLPSSLSEWVMDMRFTVGPPAFLLGTSLEYLLVLFAADTHPASRIPSYLGLPRTIPSSTVPAASVAGASRVTTGATPVLAAMGAVEPAATGVGETITLRVPPPPFTLPWEVLAVLLVAWPIGFSVLFKSLLRGRRSHFRGRVARQKKHL
eukprot:TRINITY_DN60435_c0_g1_i1.p1 TRINITY_DN60435_c0_g1~~TRINITY_DN60435_c0_g1_i1.p1  ORF type:complete len:297 (+),score=45.65 TRINITY_DN60435_c0_g1_i1:114-1004(+)